MNLRLQECTLHLDVTSRCKHLYSAQKKRKKEKEKRRKLWTPHLSLLRIIIHISGSISNSKINGAPISCQNLRQKIFIKQKHYWVSKFQIFKTIHSYLYYFL